MLLLFKLFARLPLWIARGLGYAVGWFIWLVSPNYRQMMQVNFDRACASGRLGDAMAVNSAKARAVFRESIGQAGLIAAELPKIWCDPKAMRRMSISGLESVQDLIAQGRGVVILTPHLGAFELSARVFSQHLPITVLYRPARHASFRRLMETLRPLPSMATAPATASGVRQLLRALRQGQAIGMLPDQVPGQGEGVWSSVFGYPAYTMTLPLRLAQATGAALVWGLAIRTQTGWHLDLTPWSPHADLSVEIAQQAVDEMNGALEKQIARAPEQYLWAYNRYKTPRGARPSSSHAESGAVGQP